MIVFSPTLGSGTLVHSFKPIQAALSGPDLTTEGAPVSNGKVLSEVVASFRAPNTGAAGSYGYDYTGNHAELTTVTVRTMAYV